MTCLTTFRHAIAQLGANEKLKWVAVAVCLSFVPLLTAKAQSANIRINQAGYLSKDSKAAIVMSKTPAVGGFSLVNASTKRTVFRGKLKPSPESTWGGKFTNYYELDFSNVKRLGRYYIKLDSGVAISREFTIGDYPAYQEDLLFFMRQQRCGYNPYLGIYCHQKDGKSFYGPMADGSIIDATGGWHDAGDQLKYLITASNATARMLLAYELEKDKFVDKVDANGNEQANGIADVLDEAKWGLDWIFKLHPSSDQLFHQVADDRDHRGFKLPDQDNADYGWGPNSYRPIYFADGKPQGLSKWKSKTTGVANIAGRSAAAMAMAYRIWKNDLHDPAYASKCLKAAVELYEMGKRQEGCQQGNSYGAPYRYNEDTWADDMEWAAAELYKALGKRSYLVDAKRYAAIAGASSWMQHDRAEHYQFYPFTNVGHFALYPLVDAKTKRELAGYYLDGIEKIVARGRTNPYGVGMPFLWCSNNLVVAYITQVLLYEKMTGDMRFHRSMLVHRDWLLGRNPWGTSMFTGIPADGEVPEDVHLPIVQIMKKQVPGGLVDGPIDTAIYKGLIGLHLNQPDEFAEFQPDTVVYHDDVGDYSTNEPTMDGTADAILMMVLFSGKPPAGSANSGYGIVANPRLTYEQGAIIRGDKTKKQLAIVFTGDEFADGAKKIATTLKQNNVKASFFFTGRFYRNPKFEASIRRLIRGGHYLGAHSDQHLLYCDRSDRNKLLVSREEFEKDLNQNYSEMRKFGIRMKAAPCFLPPYEWYNRTISEWTTGLGLRLVNFTPGTRSNADYTTPDMKNYIGSYAIFDSIKSYEARNEHGLNGFMLLMHVGTDPKRTDKLYERLPEMLKWLKEKGYEVVRVDRLLSK